MKYVVFGFEHDLCALGNLSVKRPCKSKSVQRAQCCTTRIRVIPVSLYCFFSVEPLLYRRQTHFQTYIIDEDNYFVINPWPNGSVMEALIKLKRHKSQLAVAFKTFTVNRRLVVSWRSPDLDCFEKNISNWLFTLMILFTMNRTRRWAFANLKATAIVWSKREIVSIKMLEKVSKNAR